MSMKQLEQLNNELQNQMKNGFNQRHRAYYYSFILDPKSSELPLLTYNERFSKHSFVLLPIDRSNYSYISYKPMFYTSIDFQFVFLASIENCTVDLLNKLLTIESNELSLNNLINGNSLSFQGKLYFGNKDKYISDIIINLSKSISINQLNLSNIQQYQSLRYKSYLLSKSIKSQIDFYLIHQIRILPDFDSIVHIRINPMNCTTDIQRDRLINLLEEYENEWAFHDFHNTVFNRLISGRVHGQLLGDIYSTICTMDIIKEIECRYFSHYSNESFDNQFKFCHRINMINHNEEKFFHGFLPIWSLILFSIAILFLILFLIGIICHLVGCRKPRENSRDNNQLSVIERSLLEQNNQLITNSIRTEDPLF